MKKLLALLMLVVCSVGSAWAQTYKDDFTDGQVIILTNTYVDQAVTDGWMTKTTTGTKNNFTPQIDPETDGNYSGSKLTSYLVKGEGVKDLQFYITNVSKVTFYAHNGGTSGDARVLYAKVNGGTEAIVTSVAPSSSSKGDLTLDPTINNKITLYAPNNDVIVYAMKVEVPASDVPTIFATPENLSLLLNPYSNNTTSSTFTIKGSNLTDGTYNLTIPTVTGLSVSPTNFTVANGSVEQEFTVTYTSNVNVAEATVNIVAEAGDVSATIPVTYYANITGYEQTTVSEAKTWDWTKLTTSVPSLADDTNPSKNDEIVFKNLEYLITFPADFDAQAIVVKGIYPNDGGKFRDGTIKFKTSVAGYITVDFSDTGSKVSETAVDRYLNVNGVNTEYYTKRNGTSDRKTTGNIFVPAGEVAITGCGEDGTSPQALCIYVVTFTPIPTPAPVTLNSYGYATYSNENTVTLDGATAYVASVDETKQVATFTSIGNVVPAKTGVLLVGDKDATVNIELGGTEPTFTKNDLKAALTAEPTSTLGNVYVLYDNSFVKYTGTELSVNKAYLVMSENFGSSNAAPMRMVFGDVTGISEINADATAADAPVYNLNGQRVNANAKGLLIKNGKKYINK